MILEVDNLHAGYGRIPVLMGATFRAQETGILGILGHNGMGKTTLLRALIGQLPATQGMIKFMGRDVTREPSHLRAQSGLGYVPQGRGIFPMMSVRDNLRMGFHGRRAEEAHVIERVLTEFPRLIPLLDRTGGTLSGGEQQLLALARCLCGEPHLMLLDEPTEGIQPSIVEEIAETLKTLNKKLRLSLIVVEQNLEFLTSLSSTTLQMQKGRIVGEGAPDSMFSEGVVHPHQPSSGPHLRIATSS